MDSLLAPESLFSAIGSGTQRLFSLDAKFSEFEIERPSSEMESDIDIIAALIVIPRSVTSIASASRDARGTLWPLIFGIQSVNDTEKLRGEYFALLKKYSHSEPSPNFTLIHKDVNRTDVSVLGSLWDIHLKMKGATSEIGSSDLNDRKISEAKADAAAIEATYAGKDVDAVELPPYQEIMCRILKLYSLCTQSDYAQGMSDILSPIFASVDFDEVLTFWIFLSFLTGKPASKGFELAPLVQDASFFSLHSFYSVVDSSQMKQALWTIGQLLRLLNIELYSHLRKNGLESLLVCYRWLLVWFKREFSFEDTCQLWEPTEIRALRCAFAFGAALGDNSIVHQHIRRNDRGTFGSFNALAF
ncbi:GTPase-activating protein Gyp7 [Mitosporidium daphniae]|uniref:GTPase-activating protein Gyp7 n=1 Tax=Mitosporidium daphniae TaxID=1485682 RepID=A0A098VVK9_9MICR|nr:GTPase-activating protein Gyp7 [Mitosporidium daphniae]KGG53173.1 GTPase-activating protein Gyp7 [Mitosporidium daphniae]|eukprot:XP_013239609.1 GTPase-activating protein Gyp7 [Mitosporidium daphniae]